MNIKSKAADRKLLLAALEEAIGTKRVYLGPPTFGFTVGDYKVDRNGDIEVLDEKANAEVIRSLAARKLIEEPETEEEELHISLPIEDCSKENLINLLSMVRSKQKLINLAIGRPGAFHIKESALTKLADYKAEDLGGIIKKIHELEEDSFKGISFDREKITFTGFPLSNNPDVNKAFTELAFAIVNAAKTKVRVRSTITVTDNPKYSFRVFLISIGLKGDRFKKTRKLLVANLPGNGAFRTKEQADRFSIRMKEKREEAKDRCSGFTPLN